MLRQDDLKHQNSTPKPTPKFILCVSRGKTASGAQNELCYVRMNKKSPLDGAGIMITSDRWVKIRRTQFDGGQVVIEVAARYYCAFD